MSRHYHSDECVADALETVVDRMDELVERLDRLIAIYERTVLTDEQREQLAQEFAS